MANVWAQFSPGGSGGPGLSVSGIQELVRDLEVAQDTVVDQTVRIVGQGANNIKKQAAQIVRGVSRRGYLPHYPRSIDYDEPTVSGAIVRTEIGPTREKLQGGLGRLIEFGSRNNAPIPHLSPALDAEEPRFARAMEDLGVRLLEGGK